MDRAGMLHREHCAEVALLVLFPSGAFIFFMFLIFDVHSLLTSYDSSDV